jgi:hypothetical protein
MGATMSIDTALAFLDLTDRPPPLRTRGARAAKMIDLKMTCSTFIKIRGSRRNRTSALGLSRVPRNENKNPWHRLQPLHFHIEIHRQT